MIIRKKAYARAGLIGNPSDGFYGKTIAIICKNFRAEVALYESPEVEILPSQQDHCKFDTLDELVADVQQNGYYGGLRLCKASIKKFHDYCQEHQIELEAKNFTIQYETNIPRQVGMGGSSAIITATMRALMEFYRVDIPKPMKPSLTLSVEKDELCISAGLQDRVIQVYEGMVYMDFAKDIMDTEGHGHYLPMDPSLLPPLFVAYRTDLSEESGVVHHDMRKRYDAGDPEVVEAMQDIAELAPKAKECLLANRKEELTALMDANFDRRASIYPISDMNRELVRRGRDLGAAAKFAGSGGAVIGVYRDQDMYEDLEKAYAEIGCQVFKPVMI